MYTYISIIYIYTYVYMYKKYSMGFSKTIFYLLRDGCTPRTFRNPAVEDPS